MPKQKKEKKIKADKYQKALAAFLKELGADDETVFAIDVQPDKAVVRHVIYTQKDNGTMSGEFWEEVISREYDDKPRP